MQATVTNGSDGENGRGAGDDLVQETWLKAIESPPKTSENMRG